jgi:hypothetical protein
MSDSGINTVGSSKVVKAIAYNRSALLSKYGPTKLDRLDGAIRKLIAADSKRGLADVLVDLSDQTQMLKYGTDMVRQPGSERQNKKAIDAVYRSLLPAYLLLLGGPDSIPHIALTNPASTNAMGGNGDEDPTVPSDLPYACDTAFSREISDFRAPTRVVGRLPDCEGVSDVELYIGLIEKAAHALPQALSQDYFALSAAVWSGSSALSCDALFSNSTALHLTPPQGPVWSQNQLSPTCHFINCHGADADWKFYGQPKSGAQSYPVAMDATRLSGNIGLGTVAAAECCYGAQLFGIQLSGGQKGIALTYLQEGACGFWGSTNIAYGPAQTNNWADLMCQYFLSSVMQGASLGRAAAEARQSYIRQCGTSLSPYDLKTLAQFLLLGDPSVSPFKPATAFTKGKSILAGTSYEADYLEQEVKERRQRLELQGKSLKSTTGYAGKGARTAAQGKLRGIIDELAATHSLEIMSINSFQVEAPRASAATKGMQFGATRFIACPAFTSIDAASSVLKGLERARISHDAVLLIKQVGDKFVRAEVLYRR